MVMGGSSWNVHRTYSSPRTCICLPPSADTPRSVPGILLEFKTGPRRCLAHTMENQSTSPMTPGSTTACTSGWSRPYPCCTGARLLDPWDRDRQDRQLPSVLAATLMNEMGPMSAFCRRYSATPISAGLRSRSESFRYTTKPPTPPV